MPTTYFPLENIVHRTESRPFSLYRTVVNPRETCALYLHCHPEAELFFLEQGELNLSVENLCFHLRGGEGIFIPPNLIHKAENAGASDITCSFCAVVFSTDMLEDSLPSYCRPYFSIVRMQRLSCIYPILSSATENSMLLAMLSSLFQYRGKNLEICELTILGTLLLCWQELYNLCFSRLSVPAEPKILADAMQQSLDYILNHYSEQLSLALLSQKTGYSQGYFCHCFKQFAGCSPFEYLSRIRIIKSCDLLARTDKKITEIASLCGFNNISYFNRTFYKIMGMNPSAYRRLLLSGSHNDAAVIGIHTADAPGIHNDTLLEGNF